MHRTAWTLVAALFAAVLAESPAQAQLFKKIHRDFRRNNCWPQPFVYPDRVAVRSPFALMINNGWRTQNTLSDDHFDPETGALNEAGELKVQSVLTETPHAYRTVYVLRAQKPELTEARNKSVAEYAAKIVQPGEPVQIAETRIKPRGTSAEYVNMIGQRYQSTTPDPRLPAPTGSASSSGSSGGSSSGTGR